MIAFSVIGSAIPISDDFVDPFRDPIEEIEIVRFGAVDAHFGIDEFRYLKELLVRAEQVMKSGESAVFGFGRSEAEVDLFSVETIVESVSDILDDFFVGSVVFFNVHR